MSCCTRISECAGQAPPHPCSSILILRFSLPLNFFQRLVDPYTQWYQLMQNYYKQFFPAYDFANYTQTQHRRQRHVPKSVVPLTQPPAQSAMTTGSSQQQSQQHFNFPGFPPWPGMSQPQFGQHDAKQMSDYAAYYYQYYLGAMAAANGWPIPTGRTTPKIFIEPHLRASLAVSGLLIQVMLLVLGEFFLNFFYIGFFFLGPA